MNSSMVAYATEMAQCVLGKMNAYHLRAKAVRPSTKVETVCSRIVVSVNSTKALDMRNNFSRAAGLESCANQGRGGLGVTSDHSVRSRATSVGLS